MLMLGNKVKRAAKEGITVGYYVCGVKRVLLLCECEKIAAYYPLLVGVSRKRIIGEIVNEKDAKNRVAGSVAAAALVAYKGAEILRVHDVKETVDAMNIVSAVVKGYI